MMERAEGAGLYQELTRSLPLVSPCGLPVAVSPEPSPAPVVINDRTVDVGEGIALACRGEVGGDVVQGSDHRGIR
jgi:hypothetical protein